MYLQKPPGVLIYRKGKDTPWWWPCERSEVREVCARHLTFNGREQNITAEMEKPTEMSVYFADILGIPVDSPASVVVAELLKAGNKEEAHYVKDHNFGVSTPVPVEEWTFLWVTQFKFVKDRKDKNIAEPAKSEILDVYKILG